MGGKSSKKKVTVGYRYYWDLHTGLGRGPIDEIVAITADKKRVFVGTPEQLSSNCSIYINKPSLFGGEDTGGEGGIQGWFDVFMGDAEQVPSGRILSLLQGVVPGFRGLVTTFFSGLISCYSASPKPWAYRVRRSQRGWDKDIWYPEKATIILRDDVTDIGSFDSEVNERLPNSIEKPTFTEEMTTEEKNKLQAEYLEKVAALEAARKQMLKDYEDNQRNIYAMNPAHILVECATNRDWGRGLLLDDLNLDSYKYAADMLYQEKFGLCFRYNRQDKLDTFVQQILDHIGAAQYCDLSTGKLTLKLIRDDYNADELPLFTYDNGIISVQDDDSVGIDSATNEIVVTYHNPVNNTDGEAKAQNLGAIQAVGLISNPVEYKALPTHGLAARVAERDIEANAAGITRLTILFDRRGSELMPASCFRVSLPDRNIDNMVLRVSKIDEKENGSLLITAIQDVFGFSSTSYSNGQQNSEWVAPDKTVTVVNDAQLIELPYALLAAELSAADLAYLNESSCYLGIMATAPTPLSINYGLQTRPAGAEFKSQGNGDWTATGTLTQDVTALSKSLYIDSEYLPSVGDGLFIDNEIMRIDAVDINNNLLTVGRGCVDSLPVAHGAGAKVRFYETGLVTDDTEYLPSETVEAQLLTQTSAGVLDASLAPIENIVMQGRQIRPYLPGNIKINGVLYPDSVALSDNYQLTFAHRDRLLQADRLIDCLADNIGQETGTEYVITITNQNGVIWSLNTASNVIDLPYDTSSFFGNAAHTLTLKAVRNDYESLSVFSVQLPVGQVIIETETEND